MHAVTGFCVTVVRRNEIFHDHLDGVDRQWIGVIAVRGRNIGLDCMGHSVHTGVCNQLLRHGSSQFRINDCHIRSNLEISDRILDAILIIGNDRKCGYLCSSSGSRRNCTEVSLGAQLRKTENLTHIFKGAVRILVLDPHSLGSVDR